MFGGVVGFGVIDRDGKLARVDRHIELITGRGAEQLLGCALVELVPGALPGRQVWHDFGDARVEVAVSLDGTAVTFKDVTRRMNERETSESELVRARDRLGFALAASGMGVWEWDPVADRVYWSEHLADLVGIAMPGPEAKLGEYAHLIHPDDRPVLLAAARRVADEGSLLEPIDARIRRPDGSWRPMQVFAHRTADGRVLAVFVDVTARQSLEAALRSAQKLEAVGQVAASVAHDFNNLLQVILLGVHELHMSVPSGALDQVADEVEGAGQRALGLARQLLTFSRTAKFEASIVDVGAVVRRLEPILQRLVKGRSQLWLSLAPDAPAVWADPTQIEQIVLNLVVNARDALGRAGSITVSTARTVTAGVTQCVLAVRDDGPGIAPELQAQIFEPFFSTKGEGKGTGLGLAVVQNVARRWRGSVTLESAPGQGTVFRVHLPAHVSQSPSS